MCVALNADFGIKTGQLAHLDKDPANDAAENLMFLCLEHHDRYDSKTSQSKNFTEAELRKFGEILAAEIRNRLDILPQSAATVPEKQALAPFYSEVLEHVRVKLRLGDWDSWISSLVSNGQPSIAASDLAAIEESVTWLLTRAWPKTNARLETALLNFRLVAHDLVEIFRAYSEERGTMLWTRKFYRDASTFEVERQLAAAFDVHVDLVEDLTAELTRAMNWVLDIARASQPDFASAEGRLSITQGPLEDFTWKRQVVTYDESEILRGEPPYVSLLQFLSARSTRDVYWGEGQLHSSLVYAQRYTRDR